jgi:copper oxidase (laccase) domain-containing protein
VDDNVLIPLEAAIPCSDAHTRKVIVEEPLRECLSTRESVRLDLAGLTRWELMELGVPPASIQHVGYCTACRPDLFFSYRRDGGKTGRQMAVAGFLE